MVSDGARGDKNDDGHAERVPEVEYGGDKRGDFKGGNEVKEGIEKNVEGRCSGGEEGTPPPVVVFGAELEVYHDDSDFRASDDENDENEEEEGEEIVNLLEPDGGEDEEEFYENSTEGKHAAEQSRKEWVQIPHLGRHGTWDLHHAHWMRNWGPFRCKMRTKQGKRHGNAKPERHQRHEVQEWDWGGRMFRPQKEV